MTHDHIEGILIGWALVIIAFVVWYLYDQWVEYTDAMRVAQWFEDTNLGDG